MATVITSSAVTVNGTALGAGGGEVKQIKYVYPTPDVVALNTGSWTEITSDLRVAITPTSASSKLIIQFLFLYNSKGSANLSHYAVYNVTDSGNIETSMGTNAGNRIFAHASARNASGDLNNAAMVEVKVITSASSTSARTYTLYHKSEPSSTEKLFFGGGSTNHSGISLTKPSAMIWEVTAT